MIDLFNNYYDISLHNLIVSTLWIAIIILQMVSDVFDVNLIWMFFVALIGLYLSATYHRSPL
jgi:hypothetical protein